MRKFVYYKNTQFNLCLNQEWASHVCSVNTHVSNNLHMMCYMYELEFFTLKHISEKFNRHEGGVARRNFPQLKNANLIYKHFDKLTPSNTREDHIFRDETKYNYRVRWGLTQKGRMYVSRYYRMCDGTETIPYPIGS